ncbi:MAG: hypothetical protein Fur0025_35430 [Oscillatoriaceae cyanobacterium]
MPLGLVEKVKKEKRPGEVSPESGSQFYQPEKEYEEVTRTYKNDAFFAQVLKQGQSPKSQGRRLAVTGEPGAGKTTLLQKTAQWVAAETEQDVAIWVSLADLQERSVEDYLLQKWLKDALRAVEVTPEMKDALALLFKSGRVWLLLDGVDEMGSSNPLATVANQISGWVASARVVVTCRQNVWDAGKNALEGFDVYRNLDFDYPEGVGQFIGRWFARHPELGERLLAELAQDGKERIRDTVRNPLRLALLCRAWQIRQGGLPETKAGLYGQFAEALYEWKQEAFPTKTKQRTDLNAGLGRLALRGMERSESRFRLKESLLREVLGKKDKPPFSLALDLGWLNLVGVAVENPDERVYAFYHPTFQEYFAALAVDDWSYFLHHVPDNPSLGTYRIFEKQWKEVILLWFGRGDVQKEKKEAEAFIEKLVNFDDGCGSWNYLAVDKGFYEYRACFLAGAIVTEFKESSRADEIFIQIVKSCISDMYSIQAEATAVLAETDRQRAIKHLTRIFNETSDEDTRSSVADSLGKIMLEIKGTINHKIAVGNEGDINRLIQLLDETSAESTRGKVADSLGNIAVGNEGAINRLIQLLDETSDEDTRRRVAYSLGRIIETKQQYYQVISAIKHNLNDEIYQNKFDLYEESYKLIWQWAQNLTYPEFYMAWHQQLTGTHTEVTKPIAVILSQLKPTAQSYPLPLDIESLADETDTSAICQELCTLIYSLSLPDTDIPTVSNFAQLKQQILTVKKQLQKPHLALIFHNCKPHPPLLTCCRKIADANLGLHILWITDETLEAPWRGFPPSQDNLLGAMQSWLEETC